MFLDADHQSLVKCDMIAEVIAEQAMGYNIYTNYCELLANQHPVRAAGS